MQHKFVVLLLCVALCFLPILSACASFAQYPTNEIFSLGYDRLQKAIQRGRPVRWRVTVEPTALGGVVSESGAMDIISAILSRLVLEGVVQCSAESGRLEATVTADDRELISLGHLKQSELTALNLTGEWLTIPASWETEAVELFSLDELGVALLSLSYDSILSGDIPFLSMAYRQGIALWGLASPYSDDGVRVSTPSGATSHGVRYEIDTAALRTMIAAWADGLSSDGLSAGLDGTPFRIGVSQEAFDAFIARIRRFGELTEVAKPITLTTTFGEGDLLRTAKGSGTISENGKRTAISYSYSCDVTSTRMTRKYRVDFQPREMDTLVLKCTFVTRSNEKDGGGQEFALDLSGQFDGLPYRIQVNSDMISSYHLLENGRLYEAITGTASIRVKYNDRIMVDITVERNGETTSEQGLTMAVWAKDQLMTSIRNVNGIVFEGLITLESDVQAGTETLADVLETAIDMEQVDLLKAEEMRASFSSVMANARQRLLAALPESMVAALSDGLY